MSKDNPEAVMRISEHLAELRKRLLAATGGILVAAVGGWFLVDPVLHWLQEPLDTMSGTRPQLNFPTIGAAFDMRLSVAIWLGFLIASPWWIYQIGAFIAPGLRRKEKIFVVAFGLTGVVLFALGALSGIWVVPKAVEILSAFTPDGAVMLLRADTYIQFFMRLVIAFGLSCLIPEILVALNFFGVLSARTMLKGWRWATVAAAVFAAIANPLPTAWPMIVQMLALLALYFLAVAIAAIHDRVRTAGGFSWRLLLPRRSRRQEE